MKKLFTLVVLTCLLGVSQAWAAISFTQNSVILNSGVSTFDFTSISLNGQQSRDLVHSFNDPWNNGNYFEDMSGDQFYDLNVGDIIRVNVTEVGTVIDTDHFVEFKKYKWYTDIDEEFSTKLIRDPQKNSLPINKYFQATITTTEILNKIKSEGMSIQYKNYTVSSIQLIYTTTWKAETFGDVVINSGFESKSGNTYNLDPSQTTTISFTGGGAIAIIAERNGERAYYMITVPYTYNEDNGYQHIWNFYDYNNPSAGPASIDNNYRTWTQFYRQNKDGVEKYYTRAANPSASSDGHSTVDGTNAYYIPSSAGLVFNTPDQRFGKDIDNNANNVLVFGSNGATFTIPQVPAGYYIRIWWDAKAEGGNGATFSVSNALDLDGKEITGQFTISGIGNNTSVPTNVYGNTIFKVKQTGDVTFTLSDNGWNEIYKIQVMKDYATDMVLADYRDGWGHEYIVRYNNEYATSVHDGSGVNRIFSGHTGYCRIQRARTVEWDVSTEGTVTFNDHNEVVTNHWAREGSNAYYDDLLLNNIKGTGNIKIIQRETFNGYTLDKNETWIAVGEYTQQSYPYTWDFTDYNVSQGSLNDGLGHSIENKYGYWKLVDNTNVIYGLDTHALVDASKNTTDNKPWMNVKIEKPLFAQGSQLNYGVVGNSVEKVLETEGLRVKQCDADESELGVGGSYDRELSFNINSNGGGLKFASQSKLNHKLYITIPNVTQGMWVFIKASRIPNEVKIGSNTLSVDAKSNGNPDTYDTKDDVWAYKVTNTGDVDICYQGETGVDIKAIGVTNIFKSINLLGYATESRNHAIDHKYEGFFTKNDVNAFCILTDEDGAPYEYKGTPIVLKSGEREVNYVPKNTGIVLYKSGHSKEQGGFDVPLFYPACNVKIQQGEKNLFKVNMMAPWVTEDAHEFETVGRLEAMQKNGDNGIEGFDYGNDMPCTKFVMSRQYYIYNKTYNSNSEEKTSEQEAFYRMRLNSGVSGTSNTMGANKAYLLIPTDKLPLALWNGGNGAGVAGQAKPGVIFMDDIMDLFGGEEPISGIATAIDTIESTETVGNGNTYHTLSGMQILGRPTEKGVYIMNGKKVLVK